MNRLMYLKGVVTLEFDQEKCVGCGMCTTVCPQVVWLLENGKASILNRDDCMECGACRTNCPAEAIRVEAGVGCAAAVINSALGRTNGSCCCVLDSPDNSEGKIDTTDSTKGVCC